MSPLKKVLNSVFDRGPLLVRGVPMARRVADDLVAMKKDSSFKKEISDFIRASKSVYEL